ncbi:hypothetical protein DDD_1741 [Nonlabens dokdonensis DSW-6]|uniref:Uncharacterized protein n=2 Tax=Nonlabens dokdonensis TaxID=328515 RepID=L7WDB2_NONDD|nr:hypothetical protein DDD_1741 [Nonlabens dokdonensis DSW-6]
MYPDEPKSNLRTRMNYIIKENGGNINKHGLTPKEWLLLKDELGEPTHDRNGVAIVNS